MESEEQRKDQKGWREEETKRSKRGWIGQRKEGKTTDDVVIGVLATAMRWR